jgi:hypothetical protein
MLHHGDEYRGKIHCLTDTSSYRCFGSLWSELTFIIRAVRTA